MFNMKSYASKSGEWVIVIAESHSPKPERFSVRLYKTEDHATRAAQHLTRKQAVKWAKRLVDAL